MFKRLPAAIIMLIASASPVWATEHIVEMLNRGLNGQPLQYEPAFLKIEPGDSVTFKSVNPGHNVVSINGMLPDGAEPFRSRLSQDVTITFDQPGLYGYKCQPHYAMGMVGLIQVGDDISNLDAAQSVRAPGRAGALFEELFSQVSN